MVYFAHTNAEGEKQYLSDHLENTAKLAGDFAAAFDSKEFGYLLGYFHDLGKYSKEFQKRLLDNGAKVDHATAGAKALDDLRLNGAVRVLLSYCIAGHHSGLLDRGTRVSLANEATLAGRLQKEVADFSCYREELSWDFLPKITTPPLKIAKKKDFFELSFWTRMLFSCLVDADYLDTASFVTGARETATVDWAMLQERFAAYMHTLTAGEKTALNIARNEILAQCQTKGGGSRGLYSLTVPTGGGKTLATLAFALEMVKKHQLSRIIYVIPYTSIIDQTVKTFGGIFGKENVLAHHANVVFNEDDDFAKEHQLATENWDFPLIVTTNVQFFESLFHNRPSICRKIHNIANSVVIFDEAQMIPRDYLIPCTRAIEELVNNYQCTALLCSATQPELGQFMSRDIIEINSHWDEPDAVFERVTYQDIDEQSDEALAALLSKAPQVLCIVNNKRQAQHLFDLLPEEGRYHLSTYLTVVDREKIIEKIREDLPQKKVCRVVATSLIEAGVDVDFPLVYRAKCGLDSIVQAAGRCNREGKRAAENSFVCVFQPDEQYYQKMPSFLDIPLKLTEEILPDFITGNKIQALKTYFKRLYSYTDASQLDKKGIMTQLANDKCHYNFSTAAKDFQLVEGTTKQVIVPLDDVCQKLIAEIQAGVINRQNMRAIARYGVALYDYQYKALLAEGVIAPLYGGEMARLVVKERYHREKGLIVTQESGYAEFF